MINHHLHRYCSILYVASLGAIVACDVGRIEAASNTDVLGDNETNATLDDVAVDHLEVHADTDVNTDIDNVVEANINFGAGGDSAIDEVAGGTSALGDGIAFTSDYRGVVLEEMTLRPTFDASLPIVSAEWLIRAPTFDAPTVLDDAAAFVWGEPDASGPAGDEYLLGVRFGDESSTIFVWNVQTRCCDAVGCAPRSISAVCHADVILRVWLTDGTHIDAVGEHRSARVTCGDETQ